MTAGGRYGRPMSDLVLPLAAAALVVAVVVLVLRRRGVVGPLAQQFLAVAERRGWSRVSPDDAAAVLAPFDHYLGGDGSVDVAVGGDADGGRVVVAAVGVRDRMARGRPWYVATVTRPDLALPRIVLEPRSVRTVRVVAGEDEVVIDDAPISRGWRITSPDPDAAAVLDAPEVRDRLSDTLHRPIPFIVGLRTVPGAVAVHLAGPEDEPGDADDVDRLARLALDVADALAAAPRPS